MPHVIVKLWPGKSEKQKERLAEKIAKDVMDVLNYGEESVSVGFEEISSKAWKESLQAGHQGQVGQALQEAGIRDVKLETESMKGRIGI